MRWPLRNQILWRIFLLLLITITVITWLLIQNRVSASRLSENEKIDQISTMIKEFPFPKKSNTVLDAMKSLSGAEFLVRADDGAIVSRTDNAPTDAPMLPSGERCQFSNEEGRWYQASIDDSSPFTDQLRSSVVSVFLPVESTSEILWRLGKTPLFVAVLVLPLALLLGLLFSNQISTPLLSLSKQTDKLASGEEVTGSFAARNDEIGDLYRTMNRMAERIRDNESQLRRGERLTALVDVGNGIAHNLGNSAAGCQMALQLLADDRSEVEQSEEYQVAIRQLELMKSYIQKFLSLSKQSADQPQAPIDAVELLPIFEQATEMLKPMSNHLGVELRVNKCESCRAMVDAEDARQVFLNLVINAIRAAKSHSIQNGEPDPAVDLSLSIDNSRPTFTVADNGAGPPEAIADEIFEPFVSGSSDGTGLGLAMIKGIADATGGSVSWSRESELTIFCFEFKPA